MSHLRRLWIAGVVAGLALTSAVGAATITYGSKAYCINGLNVPWNQFGTDVGSHQSWGRLCSAGWFDTLFTECAQ